MQQRHIVALHRSGDHTVSELVELFSGRRATIDRALERHPVETDSSVTLARADLDALDGE